MSAASTPSIKKKAPFGNLITAGTRTVDHMVVCNDLSIVANDHATALSNLSATRIRDYDQEDSFLGIMGDSRNILLSLMCLILQDGVLSACVFSSGYLDKGWNTEKNENQQQGNIFASPLSTSANCF